MPRFASFVSRGCRALAPAALALALSTGAAGCATLKAMNSAGAVTAESLQERNKALDGAVAGLAPCAQKGQPGDNGLLAVTAAPDGKISVGAVQWNGSDAGRECLVTEAAKLALPPWSGPPVSVVWAIGTNESPPPKMLEALPPQVTKKLPAYLSLSQDTETGPITACMQQNIPMEAFAVVTFRVFVFADGKVAAATPWRVKGEGRDTGYITCAREFVNGWEFEKFGDGGFTMTEIDIRRGVDQADK